jgi:pimeloyl-ACP methyl ester carboxylesterase
MAQRDRLDGVRFRTQHRRRVGDYRERSIEVRGLSLRVRERGPEDGPAVVLLHGWLDHRGSFDALAPLLGGGVHTIALDHRGHGDSSWVGAGGFYHFIEYVADLDGALDALGLGLPGADLGGPHGPVRIVGHSLGAAVTLVFAAIRPARVSHAVLLDGAPLMTRSTEAPLRIAGYLDDLKKPRTRKTVPDIANAVERMRRAQPLLPSAVAQHLTEGGVGPDPAQGGALAWKWDPLVRAHSPLPFSEGVLQALLPQVTAKVLLLRAQNGILPDEIELRSRLGRLASLELANVAGTSHHLHLEEPEVVASLIRRDWERAA